MLTALNTVEPLYSGHALQRTPLYSGHLFKEPIISAYGQTLIIQTSLQRTPLYSGHLFREPMVSAIERFHYNYHPSPIQSQCVCLSVGKLLYSQLVSKWFCLRIIQFFGFLLFSLGIGWIVSHSVSLLVILSAEI